MHPMLALILAALCPAQKLPPMKLTPGEVLTFKLDVVGAEVGTFEVRTEAPPSSEKGAAIQLSSRAKTNAFMATNVGRYDVYATALVARDFAPLRYREDMDESEVHRGTEMVFPPEGGKETIDTPIGRFTSLRFDGEAVLADNPKIKRPALMWVTDDARRLPLSGIAETRGKTIRAQLISAPGMRRAARK